MVSEKPDKQRISGLSDFLKHKGNTDCYYEISASTIKNDYDKDPYEDVKVVRPKNKADSFKESLRKDIGSLCLQMDQKFLGSEEKSERSLDVSFLGFELLGN